MASSAARRAPLRPWLPSGGPGPVTCRCGGGRAVHAGGPGAGSEAVGVLVVGECAAVEGPLAQAVMAQPWLSVQHSAWCGELQVGQTVTSVSSLIGKRQYGQVRPAMSREALTAQQHFAATAAPPGVGMAREPVNCCAM